MQGLMWIRSQVLPLPKHAFHNTRMIVSLNVRIRGTCTSYTLWTDLHNSSDKGGNLNFIVATSQRKLKMCTHAQTKYHKIPHPQEQVYDRYGQKSLPNPSTGLCIMSLLKSIPFNQMKSKQVLHPPTFL